MRERRAHPNNDGGAPETPGVARLSSRSGEVASTWVGQRWMRIVENAAPADRLAEGVERARAGRARGVRVEPGKISGVVYDPPSRQREVSLTTGVFTHEQWATIIDTMVDQAAFNARLLSGELPTNIEDVFGPLGLRLFPTGEGELRPTCGCPERGGWCVHACCLAALASDLFEEDPLRIFLLRGESKDDLLDRLRHRRQAGRSGAGPTPAYAPASPIGGRAAPLETQIGSFWELGDGLDEIDTTPRKPEVSHALLRRLGPSPFGKGGFPLVGLLATCYDVVGDEARREDPISNGDGSETTSNDD